MLRMNFILRLINSLVQINSQSHFQTVMSIKRTILSGMVMMQMFPLTEVVDYLTITSITVGPLLFY